MTSTFRARAASPKMTPSAVPIQPMSKPCVMNTPRDDSARAQAHRAQNRDIGTLVVHHHDERRHDVEDGNGDDEHQDQTHHSFFDAYGAKVRLVVLGPIAHLQSGGKPPGSRARQLGRLQDIGEPQAYPGGSVEASQSLGVFDIHQRQHAVVLLQTDLENAHHMKVAQMGHDRIARTPRSAGEDASRAGDHDGHLIAHPDLQLVGEHPAENDPIRLGRKVAELALAHGIPDGGHAPLEQGVNPADDGAAHGRRTAQQMASVSRNGAAPLRPGEPCNCSIRALQSGIGAPALLKLAWARQAQ